MENKDNNKKEGKIIRISGADYLKQPIKEEDRARRIRLGKEPYRPAEPGDIPIFDDEDEISETNEEGITPPPGEKGFWIPKMDKEELFRLGDKYFGKELEFLLKHGYEEGDDDTDWENYHLTHPTKEDEDPEEKKEDPEQKKPN